MKRSKMHSEIAKLLRPYVLRPNQVARKVLDEIEKMGMEPPKVEVIFKNLQEAKGFKIKMNKWEDENE